MSLFIEYKYITLLSSKLEKFKNISNNLWNFRCPLCGDSQKNKNKSRGYIYLKEGMYRFHCHNCGVDVKFTYFLRDIDNELYNEFVKENAFNNIKTNKKEEIDTTLFKQSRELPKVNNNYLIPLSELSDEHPACIYLYERGLERKMFKNVFWTDSFNQLLEETFGDKYKNNKFHDKGIIFKIRAFDDKDYSVIGYQFRTIDKNVAKSQRFTTCIQDGYNPMFGLDCIDFNKQIYVVEGPIDSLFIPNCVAVLTSTIWKAGIKDAIYINDCEPRNQQVVKQVKKCIDSGYKTTLLPPSLYNTYDINDIVKKYNYNTEQLLSVINTYTFQGLPAKLKFAKWKM